jgi:hypothetical protein
MVFAPWASSIEVSAEGLDGCRVQIIVDEHQTLELTVPEGGRAYTYRPVEEGRHRVGVRWRGCGPDRDPGVRAVAVRIRPLAQVEAENPDLFRAMMKHHNAARFVLVGQVIISFPRGNECHVYGIFTIDKEMLRRGDPGAPVIKQDFLVFEPGSDPARAIYYTGMPEQPHATYQHIDRLCERFGEPHYGCRRRDDGSWRCADHHYRLDEIDRLPVEPEFRAAIAASIERARAELAQQAR